MTLWRPVDVKAVKIAVIIVILLIIRHRMRNKIFFIDVIMRKDFWLLGWEREEIEKSRLLVLVAGTVLNLPTVFSLYVYCW
jgi:hypothetical protein